MNVLSMLPLVLLLADPAAGDGWTRAHEADGVIVYSRPKPGTEITELKAVGMIDAAPAAVLRTVLDYPAYPRTMPYVEAAEVLGRDPERGVIIAYNRVAAPLIDKRDYVLEVRDVSDWRDGKGYLKVEWKTTTEKAPPPREGVVRVRVNDGYWLLEPREGGKKTQATYFLSTDPGGQVPRWIVNRANTSGIPDVFKALRKHSRPS